MVSEIIGAEEEWMEVESNLAVDSLCDMLEKRWSKLESVQYKVAINHSVSNMASVLEENDDVTILPPFSGG